MNGSPEKPANTVPHHAAKILGDPRFISEEQAISGNFVIDEESEGAGIKFGMPYLMLDREPIQRTEVFY